MEVDRQQDGVLNLRLICKFEIWIFNGSIFVCYALKWDQLILVHPPLGTPTWLPTTGQPPFPIQESGTKYYAVCGQSDLQIWYLSFLWINIGLLCVKAQCPNRGFRYRLLDWTDWRSEKVSVTYLLTYLLTQFVTTWKQEMLAHLKISEEIQEIKFKSSRIGCVLGSRSFLST